MNYGLIKEHACFNIAVFDDVTESTKVIFIPKICDDIVLLPEGFGTGDICKDGVWYKGNADSLAFSPAEIRKQAYQTMTTKEDVTDLIPWEGKAITVDQANKVFLEYSAEGSHKTADIQSLIVEAKAYIRELYPDE